MANESMSGPGPLGHPDRMINYAPEGLGGGTEPDLRAEAMARQAFYTDRGETRAERSIRRPKSPSEVIKGIRLILEKVEDSRIVSEAENRWDPSRVVDIIFARMQDLSVPVDELMVSKLIKNYDPETGCADLMDEDASIYAVTVNKSQERRQVKWLRDPGGEVTEVEEEMTTVYKYNFGKYARNADASFVGKLDSKGNLIRNEREAMREVYERSLNEFNARLVLNTHMGIRMSPLRDNLEGLVTTLYERASKLKIPHLKELLNLASPDGVDKDSKDNKLGGEVEKCMWWYMAMLNSETPEKLEEFLSRPATKVLIGKDTFDADLQRFLKQQLGDWKSWKRGKERKLKGTDTLVEERKDKKRGPVSYWGNIPGRGERLGYDTERAFIETIAELSGAKDSTPSWLAATILRTFGVFASEGYVVLENGETKLALGESVVLSSDDMGKYLMFLTALKEGMQGRPTGLKDTIGKMPDIAISFFDVQIQVGVDSKGEPIKMTIRDAWLGKPGESKDKYRRLGNLNFGSLITDIHGSFFQMLWLMGREEWGVVPIILKTDFKFEDFNLNTLKKIWKYFGIVYNPFVLGVDKTEAETIARNAFITLMASRVNSQSFALNILPRDTEVFTTSGNVRIPQALAVDLFIQTVIDGNPKTEEEILRNYVDHNSTFRKIENKKDLVDKMILKYQDWLKKSVGTGKIFGKNTF